MLRQALLVSLILCAVTGVFLISYGKQQSFLIINGAHTRVLDVFFQYCTFLGNGIIYIPLLIYCMFFNRGVVVAAVLSVVICLLVTHFLKRVVFPSDLRPISLEAQQVPVHKIKGLHINHFHSFPSGHTATAFSTTLLLVAILKKKVWAYTLPLLPFLVGYSRVYLAQHFVSDVLGGMVLGIATTILALWLQPIVARALPHTLQLKLKPREL